MDRKEFLSLFGIGAAALLYSSCLYGCQAADNPITAPTNVNFTLNLTDPSNAALTKDGGYLYNGGVIVARVSAGNFIAVSAACTHQGQNVQYSSGQFYCSAHGSSFSANGTRTGGPARSSLQQYNVSLNGSSLRVFS